MSEDLFTDTVVRAELQAFFDRACSERGFPRERANALQSAFERGLKEDGKWAPIVLKDLGLEPVQAYRRVAPPKDQRHG